MNIYSTKEKLLAIQLLGMARQSIDQLSPRLVDEAKKGVQLYANPEDREAATEAVLTLAAEYARNGADLMVLQVLEYPDTARADK